MITLSAALQIAHDKEGYIPCTNPEHGYGEDVTIDGKTGPALFVLCPIVQFYPLPIYLFHSQEDFLESCESYYKQKGWL